MLGHLVTRGWNFKFVVAIEHYTCIFNSRVSFYRRNCQEMTVASVKRYRTVLKRLFKVTVHLRMRPDASALLFLSSPESLCCVTGPYPTPARG